MAVLKKALCLSVQRWTCPVYSLAKSISKLLRRPNSWTDQRSLVLTQPGQLCRNITRATCSSPAEGAHSQTDTRIGRCLAARPVDQYDECDCSILQKSGSMEATEGRSFLVCALKITHTMIGSVLGLDVFSRYWKHSHTNIRWTHSALTWITV